MKEDSKKKQSKKEIKDPNRIILFETNHGVEIEMIKRNNKYNIIVSDKKKKIKSRKVFESLDTDVSMKQFMNYCNFFTKQLD